MQVLDTLRKIEARGAFDLAHRVKQVASQVFNYGIAAGRCTVDPCVGLKKALTPHVATILNEQGWRHDVIERQLAHEEDNKVRAAYNRAEYLPERIKLMQHWADHIDMLRADRQAPETPTGSKQALAVN
ncbi:prophage CP4-57 integrase [mine drainage metagenome]|uniref:Prophage CP4-57 integrase n=1 Tax=mine drainage metagenome TaxID=410659 RepID=A0A1J5QRR3_9ZZZZ